MSRRRWTAAEVDRLKKAVNRYLSVPQVSSSTAIVSTYADLNHSSSNLRPKSPPDHFNHIDNTTTNSPLNSSLLLGRRGLWKEIAAEVGTRSNTQCFRKFFNSLSLHHDRSFRRGAWTPAEDQLLMLGVRLVGAGQWQTISADLFQHQRSADQCLGRYFRLSDRSLRLFSRKVWTASEVQRWKEAMRKQTESKINWEMVAQHVQSRSPVQCRLFFYRQHYQKNKEEPLNSLDDEVS